MQTATRKGAEADVLVAGLAAIGPVVTVEGLEGCAPQADAGEAPAAIVRANGEDEQRAELDERILAALVHA